MITRVRPIVCLANSYKPPGGRCIAGKEILPGGAPGPWIRPVSVRPTAEVSLVECGYVNGQVPRLLDIIAVPLSEAVPTGHQTENYLIDETARWVKKGELQWDDLEALRDRPETLWINADHTSQGHYDCIGQAAAKNLNGSLLLIKKKHFTVEIGRNSFNGKKTYRDDNFFGGAMETRGMPLLYFSSVEGKADSSRLRLFGMTRFYGVGLRRWGWVRCPEI